MKGISEYIIEKLKVNKDTNKLKYTYCPENKRQLQDLLHQLIRERGKDADLNDIDVSKIKEMNALFTNLQKDIENIDISKWNVSNCTNFEGTFYMCEKFDCDLSDWNISNATNIGAMFYGCKKFKGIGIGKWNVENIEDAGALFGECENFNADLSRWDTSNMTNTFEMFKNCKKFTGEGLDKWTILCDADKMDRMFNGCDSLEKIPDWYADIDD